MTNDTVNAGTKHYGAVSVLLHHWDDIIHQKFSIKLEISEVFCSEAVKYFVLYEGKGT